MKRYQWKWRHLPLLLALVLVISSIVYLSGSYRAMPEAIAAAASTDEVIFSDVRWLSLSPTGTGNDTGILFYPGGKVDPKAYLPMAQALAESGCETFIVPMPFNLAIFSPNAAEKVIAANPGIRRWVIGGHSLGGVMAAKFAKAHPESISGLFLLASYPMEKDDLSGTHLPVLSLYGTRDGFVDAAKIEASKALLPADAEFVPIQGGNHSQMGWYGFQKGDGEADLTREAQQQIVVNEITRWLASQ